MRHTLTWVGKALPLAGGTMTGDIAMGGSKVTGQGAPTVQDDGLRFARAEIGNTSIASDADIAITKLALALAITNAHIKADADIVESKLDLDQGTQAVYDKIATDIGTHADLLTGLHGIIKALKTSDQTITTSTTLTNATELLFAGVVNAVYSVFLLFRFNAHADPDLKWAFSVPSGATIVSRPAWELPYEARDATSAKSETDAPGVDATIILHFLVVMSTNAGNIQFQFAQNASSAEDTKVLADSFIIAHKLA